MSTWYGSLTNRLEEGRNLLDREIRPGDDITMYMWSDRYCYYVTQVESEKRLHVKPYSVCADKSKPGGMGHQNWVYFKTLKEKSEYLGLEVPPGESLEAHDAASEEVWVFRYRKWKQEVRNPDGSVFYIDLPGKITFGLRDYYYDWEF